MVASSGLTVKVPDAEAGVLDAVPANEALVASEPAGPGTVNVADATPDEFVVTVWVAAPSPIDTEAPPTPVVPTFSVAVMVARSLYWPLVSPPRVRLVVPRTTWMVKLRWA